VANALKDLEAKGWLAIRRYCTPKGSRAFSEYYVHRSRRLTSAEIELFSEPVVLGGGPKTESAQVVQDFASGWYSDKSIPGSDI
jgi:hypothetical protein